MRELLSVVIGIEWAHTHTALGRIDADTNQLTLPPLGNQFVSSEALKFGHLVFIFARVVF